MNNCADNIADPLPKTGKGAGKVLGTVKCQPEYAMLKGEEPDIEFLGKTSGRDGPTYDKHGP